ncbi:hypothetical protein AVEN_242056-1 [Araneus ventricosus]|uniref:Uncharacterized protein n=1 Tax=Araneus ventricosus TaxID=182803 RepID=A0A4Y2THT0_ARAVE|nr:hypothetical protein AVEN_242056-1 [Araneus ventricosus]
MTLLHVKRNATKLPLSGVKLLFKLFRPAKTIAQAGLLAHPNSEAKLSLVVDASNTADAFSRIDEIGIPSEIDYEEIARAQADDEEFLTLQDANSNLVFKTISLEPRGTPLHYDVSTGSIRPYVPKAFRTTIINVIHSLAHSGAKATANAVKQRFM